MNQEERITNKKAENKEHGTRNHDSLFMLRYSPHSGAGFTLVELLVSFTLFTIIMSIITSIFITSHRTERNIAALILVNDNTYIAIEQMARDIRDGRDFDFTDPILGVVNCSGDCFGFTGRSGEKIIYDLDTTNPAIRRSILNGSSKNLTADNINVESFLVTPINCNYSGPPDPLRVTLNLKVRPKDILGAVKFVNNIQTTVSTRNFAKCIP